MTTKARRQKRRRRRHQQASNIAYIAGVIGALSALLSYPNSSIRLKYSLIMFVIDYSAIGYHLKTYNNSIASLVG